MTWSRNMLKFCTTRGIRQNKSKVLYSIHIKLLIKLIIRQKDIMFHELKHFRILMMAVFG